MSVFKNRLTGDVLTIFGAVHDAFLNRPDYELVTDERDAATTDPAAVPAVLDDESPAEDPKPRQQTSRRPARNRPADDASDNPRSSK